MSDDKIYKDGDIVWVKLGNNWWPGEVTALHRQPEGLVKHLKRKPYCVVKFFNEDTFEYVRSAKQIFPFQCNKKNEFIKKGFALYNAKNKFMEKFPSDVEVAERLTRKDTLIINDRPDSIVKAILGQPLSRRCNDSHDSICGDSHNANGKRRSGDSVTKILNLTPNRTNVTTSELISANRSNEYSPKLNSNSSNKHSLSGTPTTERANTATLRLSLSSIGASGSNTNFYQCNFCDFTSLRQNVMILHRKMHNSRSNNTIVANTMNSTKRTAAPATLTTSTKTSTFSKNTNVTLPKHETEGTMQLESNEPVDTSAVTSLDVVRMTSPGIFLKHKSHQKKNRHTTVNGADEHVIESELAIISAKVINRLPKKKELASLANSASYGEADNERRERTSSDKGVDGGNVNESTTAVSTRQSASPKPKRNSEEIRQSLLADWSDEEETLEIERMPKVQALQVESKLQPVESPEGSSPSSCEAPNVVRPEKTGISNRIRNIPKKDRRDIVLKEFSNDISTSSECVLPVSTPVVSIDSGSNSSDSSVVVVNDVEQHLEKEPSLNNSEESKKEREKEEIESNVESNVEHENMNNSTESKAINQANADSEKLEIEPTAGSEHTTIDNSTTNATLSCFDFQEEDDECTSIAHFKKKHISPEKTQTTSIKDGDLLTSDKSIDTEKSHEELAQDDQKLADEIETLLEQTVPTPALVTMMGVPSSNDTTKDDSVSVKGLPIKERGKRIFKSRNRSRVDEITLDGVNVSECNSAEETFVGDETIDKLKSPKSSEEDYTKAVVDKQDNPRNIATLSEQTTKLEENGNGKLLEMHFTQVDNVPKTNVINENEIGTPERHSAELGKKEELKELSSPTGKFELQEPQEDVVVFETSDSTEVPQIREVATEQVTNTNEETLSSGDPQVIHHPGIELTNRATTPTDENSSMGISETGAEFGSPASMLDDERLPILTDSLISPTDEDVGEAPDTILKYNINKAEINEVPAGNGGNGGNSEKVEFEIKESILDESENTGVLQSLPHSSDRNDIERKNEVNDGSESPRGKCTHGEDEPCKDESVIESREEVKKAWKDSEDLLTTVETIKNKISTIDKSTTVGTEFTHKNNELENLKQSLETESNGETLYTSHENSNVAENVDIITQDLAPKEMNGTLNNTPSLNGNDNKMGCTTVEMSTAIENTIKEEHSLSEGNENTSLIETKEEGKTIHELEGAKTSGPDEYADMMSATELMQIEKTEQDVIIETSSQRPENKEAEVEAERERERDGKAETEAEEFLVDLKIDQRCNQEANPIGTRELGTVSVVNNFAEEKIELLEIDTASSGNEVVLELKKSDSDPDPEALTLVTDVEGVNFEVVHLTEEIPGEIATKQQLTEADSLLEIGPNEKEVQFMKSEKRSFGVRRKTVSSESSGEDVPTKKLVLDNSTLRKAQRTAEHKMTFPVAEPQSQASLSPVEKVHINVDVANPLSSQIANILATNNSQQPATVTVTKKRLPSKVAGGACKRKLSIEDDITSFIIERPKAQVNAVTASTLKTSDAVTHVQNLCPQVKITRREKLVDTVSQEAAASLVSVPAGVEDAANIFDLPILLQNEQLLQELIQPATATSVVESATNIKIHDGPRILHQQIIQAPHMPAATATASSLIQHHQQSQKRKSSTSASAVNSKSSMTKNKQIGVDSRGNKYVIIKTPPVDLVVQQQLLVHTPTTSPPIVKTSSAHGTGTSTFNIGSVTVRPIEDPKRPNISPNQQSTKSKSAAAAMTGGRKQAGNIITLPTTITIKQKQQRRINELNELAAVAADGEVLTKTTRTRVLNQRRKSQQPKAATTLSEKPQENTAALNRRISIATDTPSPAKIPKTAATMAISGNSHITNDNVSIAQQQLFQLQQQQQQQRFSNKALTSSVSSSPPTQQQQMQLSSALHNRKIRRQQQQQQQQQQTNSQQRKIDANAKSQQAPHRQMMQSSIQQHQVQLQLQSQSQFQQQQQQVLHQQQEQLPQNSPQQPHLQPTSPTTTRNNEEPLVQTQTEESLDATSKILAVPTQPIPGYKETFLLCTLVDNNYKPIDNVPLYLDHDLNQLVPVPLEALDGQPNLIVNHPPPEETTNQIQQEQQQQPQQQPQQQQQQQQPQQQQQQQQQPISTTNTIQSAEINDNSTQLICLQPVSDGVEATNGTTVVLPQQLVEETSVADTTAGAATQMAIFMPTDDGSSELVPNNAIILNIEGQQIILDAATFAHLLANPDANTQLITDDGTEFVLTREVLAALQVQHEAHAVELAAATQQQISTGAGPTDILAVALAGSDLYGSDVLEIDTSQGLQLIGTDGSIVFQPSASLTQPHLTPPITAKVSETNALLNQTPIMSTLESPSTMAAAKHKSSQLTAGDLTNTASLLATTISSDLSACRPNLEDSLAVIGVTTQSSTVPTSLELPITVTNPNIAPKVTLAAPPTDIVQFTPHRSVSASASAAAAAVAAAAAAALASETRMYNDPGS